MRMGWQIPSDAVGSESGRVHSRLAPRLRTGHSAGPVEDVNVVKPPGILTVECSAGYGVSVSVPIVIADIPSVGSADDLDVRFVAEAPKLHDYIYTHLQTCPAPRPRSADVALHKAAG